MFKNKPIKIQKLKPFKYRFCFVSDFMFQDVTLGNKELKKEVDFIEIIKYEYL